MEKIKKFFDPFFIAAFLLCLCLAIGTELSLRKPLWNDEIFTQKASIDRNSYLEILTINEKFNEGNSCPLYYILQKATCDLMRFKLKEEWHWGEIEHPLSQVIMRINSNIFTSLTVAVIFYFLTRLYSIWVGLYAAGVALSTFLLLYYWVEARPYSLLLFLTAVQSLIFIRILKSEGNLKKSWGALSTIHVLLALTSVAAAIQITLVSLSLWLWKERKKERFIFLFFLPLALILFYQFRAPHFQYQMAGNPLEMIYSNLPLDRVGLIFGFILLAYVQRYFKLCSLSTLKAHQEQIIYLIYAILLFLAVLGVVGLFVWINHYQGFVITPRYFIFLSGVGMFATIFSSLGLWRMFKEDPWMRINILIVLVGLLAVRFLRAYMYTIGQY